MIACRDRQRDATGRRLGLGVPAFMGGSSPRVLSVGRYNSVDLRRFSLRSPIHKAAFDLRTRQSYFGRRPLRWLRQSRC